MFFFYVVCNQSRLSWESVDRLFSSMTSEEFDSLLPLPLSNDSQCVRRYRASSDVSRSADDVRCSCYHAIKQKEDIHRGSASLFPKDEVFCQMNAYLSTRTKVERSRQAGHFTQCSILHRRSNLNCVTQFNSPRLEIVRNIYLFCKCLSSMCSTYACIE